MWTASKIGLHQIQTSELYPKGELSKQGLNSAETNYIFFLKSIQGPAQITPA